MKRKIAFILSIMLACSLVFAMGATTAFAAAATGVVFQVDLGNRSYANGETVTPTLTLGNTSGADIAIQDIGFNGHSIIPAADKNKTIAAGSQYQTKPSITADFSGGTTQALSFTISYTQGGSTYSDSQGIQINANAATAIKLDTSTSVSNKSINAGDKVKFTFKVTNSGSVAVTNLSLKAPPLNGGAAIGTPVNLNPGDSKTMEWSENINQTIAVKPVLSFTASNTNKTQSLSTINVTVKKAANSSMTVELKADKDNINPGDPINITATVTNTGDDTLKNIKLLDGNNNPVTLQVTTLNKGQSTTATIPESPQATAQYQFTATGTNSTGSAVNATSNQLSVTVGGSSPSASPSSSGSDTETSEVAALKILVDADTYTLDKAGNVKFKVTVQNTSNVLLNNVQVTEKNTGKNIGVVSNLGKDTKEFNPVFNVEKTSQFIFTVTATQQDGKTITATTDPLSIKVSGGALFGGDTMTTILIIVIIAIAVVGLILFLLYRRNRSGGGYGGGGSNRGAYNAPRKPSAPYKPSRDVEPPKVVRKPVSTGTKPPVRKDTNFGDRNKF